MPTYIRWVETQGTGDTVTWANMPNNIWCNAPVPTGSTLPYFSAISNTSTLTNTFWVPPMGFNTTDTWVDQQNMLVMLSQQYIPAMPHVIRSRAEDEEAVRRIQERQARLLGGNEQQNAKLEEERKAAEAKARELLLRHLTPEQAAAMKKNNWFVVEGGKSKKKYRIHTRGGYAGNIEEICEKGQRVATLCCHSIPEIPVDDQYLTQKLMLELDEEAFLRVANRR